MLNAPLEHRMNISRAKLGKKLTEEQKITRCRGTRGRYNAKLRKPIIQMDLNMNVIKEHISLAEASRQIFGDVKKVGSISVAITKNRPYKGFLWKKSNNAE